MPRKKNSATEAALARAVKSFNQRVDRAVASGRLTAETAPTRRSMKEIRESLVGLSPQMRGKAMKALTSELRLISEKDALRLVKTDGGIMLTKYEIEKAERDTKKARRNIDRSQAQKRKQQREAAKIAGQRAEDVPAWSDGIQPAKPTQSKDIAGAREKLRQLELLSIGGEWAKYRQNLITNLQNHYTGADLRKALDFLRGLSDAELKTLYEKDADFASQDYHYEGSASIGKAIDEAKSILNT